MARLAQVPRVSSRPMRFAPRISYSIVSHGQGTLIRPLLEDLQSLNDMQEATAEIIVTLNIPEDEQFLEAAGALPLTVLRNSRRQGFGSNHNAAFRRAAGAIFVVLNPDVRMQDFSSAPMFEALADPVAGAWAPLVRRPGGGIEDSARRFPTLRRLGRRVLLGERTRDYATDRSPLAVDWVAGMFIAFPRMAFQQINGFDERYFMYMEDAEICRRLERSGLRVIYDPRTEILHNAQRSSRKNLQHLRWHLRSAARFLVGI